MFTIVKSANRDECRAIMERIRAEEPSYWPHGCSLSLFESSGDDVYLIRKKASSEPVGFAGWQERAEHGIKIGYYAIGILPEYRNNGLAKEAVSKLIRSKSASVDCVKALIMAHNTPSLRLAESLDIPVVKTAAWKNVLKGGLGGLGTAAGADYMMHDGDYEHWSPMRIGNAVLNTALGAGGTLGISKGLAPGGSSDDFMKGLAAIGLVPSKDLAFGSLSVIPRLNSTLDAARDSMNAPKTEPAPLLSKAEKIGLMAALGIGGAGLGIAGLTASNAANKLVNQQGGGRIQVRLPTRNPSDQETTLDVPLNDNNLPPTLRSMLLRDTRRKLRQETRARTWQRGPDHKLLTRGEERDSAEDDAELEKTASAVMMFANLFAKDASAAGSAATMTAPIQPQKSMQIVNTLQKTGPDGQPVDQDAEAALQNQEQQKQFEGLQSEVQSRDSEIDKANQAQQKLQLDLHKQTLENQNLQAQLERQKNDVAAISSSASPSSPLALNERFAELNNRVTKTLTKLANIDPFLALRAVALVKLAADQPPKPKYEPLVPANGSAGEADFYKGMFDNGSFSHGVQNFAFGDNQKSVDDTYNKFAPQVSPDRDSTLRDRFKQWGANTAATGEKAWNFIKSPFQSSIRGFSRAFGRAGDFHGQLAAAGYNPLDIPDKAWGELASGVGDAGRGVVQGGLGALGVGTGGLLPAALSSVVPSNGDMPQAPAAATPSAPAPVAPPPSGSPNPMSNPAGYQSTVDAFGPTGAMNMLQQGGGAVPRVKWEDNPFYADATNYKNPWMGQLAKMLGGFTTKMPTNTAFGGDLGPGGGMRPGMMSPEMLQQMMTTLQGGGAF